MNETLADTTNLVGALTARRYAVQTKIGEGGMGIVYRAHDERTREPFAIKMLVGGLSRPLLGRVGQLVIDLASVKHPAVVSLVDYGESRAQLWIASDLLHGRSLEDEISQRAFLPPDRAREIALQVARALEAAHARSLGHFDLKASNVFLRDDRTVSVLGVGLLNAVVGDDEHMRGLLTTPTSRAPEISFADSLDHRVDVYALGALMFRMLAGHHAFALKSEQLLASRLGAKPPRLSSLVPDVPSDLEDVVQGAMAPSPKDRFGSMRELRGALRGGEDG